MKKIIITIGVLIGIAFLVVGLFYGSIYYIDHTKYCVEEFDTYKADFERVGKFCKQVVNAGDDPSDNWVSVNKSGLYYNGEQLALEEDVSNSLAKIKEAFPHKDARLDIIRCYDETIVFATHNGLYSVVFSPGGKPGIMNTKDDSDVFVTKIQENWYHAVKK